MPPFHEVRYYLTGLWLLVRGDAQGFRLLDLSDRGMLRSFWAFAWCLPAMLVSWLWWRMLFLHAMPQSAKIEPVFFLRLAMLEVIDWFVPLILASLVCALLGIGNKFVTIVTVFNWLSVPFSYAYAVLSIGFLLSIGLEGVLAITHLLLLLVMIVCMARILRAICGPQPLVVTALLLVLIVPDMLLSELLQRYLGVYPA